MPIAPFVNYLEVERDLSFEETYPKLSSLYSGLVVGLCASTASQNPRSGMNPPHRRDTKVGALAFAGSCNGDTWWPMAGGTAPKPPSRI